MLMDWPEGRNSYLGFDTRKEYVIFSNKVQRRKEFVNTLKKKKSADFF